MNNYHNDYALPLEEMARDVLGIAERQRGAIFDADSIELGTFFEVMIITLRVKNCYQRCSEIDDFIEKYGFLLGKALDSIEEPTIIEAFREYKLLLKIINNN